MCNMNVQTDLRNVILNILKYFESIIAFKKKPIQKREIIW